MRILIVDDERPARTELERLLKRIGVSGLFLGAACVSEALGHLADGTPDVVFLDIEMPGGDGFMFLEAMGASRPPIIITTAHEQFATRAFDAQAFDYLLKPFGEERLAKTVARLPTPTPSTSPKLSEGDFFKLTFDGVTRLIPVEHIEFFETTGSVTNVFVNDSTAKLNKPLRYFSERLDQSIFFMAARDQLINLRKIDNFTVEDTGCVKAQLECRRTVLFSRRRSRIFKKFHSL